MLKLLYPLILVLSFAACGKPIHDRTQVLVPHVQTVEVDPYQTARTELFGKLHYNNGIVTDVYCDEDHKSNHGVGQGRIPDPKFLNCEHTWPQSKFQGSQSPEMKVDLHHLYPTNSQANSARSNLPFGEVTGERVCGDSYKGKINGTNVVGFEPPDKHKGNVARSMFYFSVKYRMPIDPIQESYFRAWHVSDPVDQFERNRNRAINLIQHDLNPFIENPSLVNTIKDF